MSRRIRAGFGLVGLGGLAGLALLVSCRAPSQPASDGVGVFLAGERAAEFHLRAADGRLLKIEIGATSGLPVAGDWDGDGRDTIGYFEPDLDAFFLSDDLGSSPQFSRIVVGWNCSACVPVAGDFGGVGADGVGLYDPSRGLFLLRDRAVASAPLRTVAFGEAGVPQWPVAGKFSACGEAQLGLYDAATATFRIHGCRASDPIRTLQVGTPGGLPVAGRWRGAEHDGVGVFEPAAGRFLLRANLGDARDDLVVPFFYTPAVPIAGHWSIDSP